MREMNLFGNNASTEKKTPANLRGLLSRLAQHLANSSYIQGDVLVFKGGLFLGEHTGLPRYTQDVDMSIVSVDSYVWVKRALSEFGEILKSEGVISSYEIQDNVMPGHSGGAKFRSDVGRVLLSVDVSLGGDRLDAVVMDTSVAGTVRLTSVEQVLADKLSVLFSPKRFRRSKDLYDVWQIISNCSVSSTKLIKCLSVRNVYPLPAEQAPFSELCYVQMEHAYNTLQIRDPNTEALVVKPPFSEIVATVGKFTSVLMGAEV